MASLATPARTPAGAAPELDSEQAESDHRINAAARTREGRAGATALTGQSESQVQKAVTVSNGDRQVGPGPEPATRRLKVPNRKC